jgi:uncharacterized membrane protein
MATLNYTTLATVPLLEGLQPDDLNALAPNFESQTYEKGETLFIKGDPGGALLIVISGIVELFIYDENKNPILLSRVTQGGFFGEITLFDSSERTANAIATETAHVLVLRQKVMVDFLLKHPEAAIHVINVLSKRLRDTTDLLVTNKNRQAYDIFQEQRSIWDRVADRASHLVGSWRYLSFLILVVIAWVILNASRMLGIWDRPFEFNILNLTLTIVGALQVPLILMSQRKQDDYSRISADLEYQVNLKAQLSILEVNRKLDWLRESMLDQTARLERLEGDHGLSSATEVVNHSLPVKD